ncbi:ParB/RepB/Spo0J family partition protein [Bifidobacterium phasiani]|uniref:ParB/RepB/Spo0J family partition protein n=1 Tax=Bifidobacterium phasiani TaxID=2834431 RepID=A0ABS6W8B7_9BIFI|nr:ParB/RepB/Spo0J family partition protein [Bifidobacterium phasiani]MBW3081991.1 ParB/RepB/Spo0J family partition protein [Bifidobacterium phasiani]
MSTYTTREVRMIPVDLIDPHPDNPRKHIGDLTDLAASIKTNGLLSPLSVVHHGTRYRVIAGHRRLAALKQAGLTQAPAFILDLTPLQQLEAMITENTQREQLTVLEEADAIQGMLQLGATIQQTADQLGRSQTYIRERRRIARIGDRVRESRADFAQLSFTELQAIAEFDGDLEAQEELAGAAGGNEFAWRLDRCRDRRERRKWVSEARDAVGGLGLESLPVDVERYWMSPDGYEIARSFSGVEDSFRDQWRDYALDHDTDGLFVHVFDDGVVVAYRAAESDAPDEGYRERTRREQLERRARERPFRELDERSRRLREQWIGRTVFQLNLDTLTDLVVDLTGLLLIGAHPSPSLCQGLGCDQRDLCIQSYNRMRSTNPLPDTDKDPKDNVWHLDTDRNLDELANRTTESLPELACLMCAAIEARITWTDWTKPTPLMRDYYHALTAAGYPTSDQEQRALADKEETR